MSFTRVYAPKGFDTLALLRKLNSRALETSPEYRRAITRTSPLLFSLVYLPEHLSSDDTGGKTSFSQLHIDMARSARRWIRNDLGPAELREAWIAPRGAAKSTWGMLILPLWALAHGHQKFVMSFSNAGDQAKKHLATLTGELRKNPRLQRDFPKLCLPETANSELYVAASGAAIAAKGMDASTLGVKIGNQRPTLLILDDCEPDEANYDSTTKRKRLSTITNTIFPMSLNAVVQWAATVTCHGSLAHDLVKSATGQGTAEWITEQNLKTRYYPAILTDDDGRERSLWPQRWKMSYLDSIRKTRMYQLNYANIPRSENGTFWEASHFKWHSQFPIDTGVLSVDPAVTNKAVSDFSGLAVVAADPAVTKVCVMSARQVRVSPAGLAETVAKTLRQNRWITTVLLEANQGGETWQEILRPHLPAGVKLELHYSRESKTVRYADVLDLYEAGKVFHAKSLPALEDQQLACPNLVNDDVLDAAVAGIRYYLHGATFLR